MARSGGAESRRGSDSEDVLIPQTCDRDSSCGRRRFEVRCGGVGGWVERNAGDGVRASRVRSNGRAAA